MMQDTEERKIRETVHRAQNTNCKINYTKCRNRIKKNGLRNRTLEIQRPEVHADSGNTDTGNKDTGH
jgi:hypothetical protein